MLRHFFVSFPIHPAYLHDTPIETNTLEVTSSMLDPQKVPPPYYLIYFPLDSL